jgi:hypothetical protein
MEARVGKVVKRFLGGIVTGDIYLLPGWTFVINEIAASSSALVMSISKVKKP